MLETKTDKLLILIFSELKEINHMLKKSGRRCDISHIAEGNFLIDIEDAKNELDIRSKKMTTGEMKKQETVMTYKEFKQHN